MVVVLVTQAIGQQEAIAAIDWNTLGLLAGMITTVVGRSRMSECSHARIPLPMSVDAELAERVRDELIGETGLAEKAMFGGLGFLVDGNMAVGITSTGELMVRVGADGEHDALADPRARPFDIKGRPMKGWILVERAGIETEPELNGWVRRGVECARGLPAKR